MHSRPIPDSAVSFVNARLGGDEITNLRIVGRHIAAVGADPHPDDTIVDLEGDRVFPGLINAHDHLQLNSLPPPDFLRHYRNVRDWFTDVHERRSTDPAFQAGVAAPRDQRLLIGGMKNLLSGVTTVAHHDPLYSFLSTADFPTRVVRNFGWSHSIHVSGEEQVQRSHRRTPAAWPWIVHAGEGLDEEAGREFERLGALGCLGSNTLLVHGIALSQAQRNQLGDLDAGLIWCPASNMNLFGATTNITHLVGRGRVALGTDSRLSGSRDLLDELRVAATIGGLDDETLERLVTSDSARLLRLPDRGSLRPGTRADMLILPARTSLRAATRADVRLVLIDGLARYGDRDCAACVAPTNRWAEVRVDGRTKILDGGLADLVTQCAAKESGLELIDSALRVA
jgi:hypothetical protein